MKSPLTFDLTRVFASLCGLLLLLGNVGCASAKAVKDPVFGKEFQVSNVFTAPLTHRVQRVAMLPLTAENSSSEVAAAPGLLSPVLNAALQQARRYEIVSVTPEQLLRWSGQKQWRTTESLPPELLNRIQTETGCDAVFFAHVTGFRAYPPLAVGWRLQLVSAQEARPLWATDEWFDASDATVVVSARKYQRAVPQPGMAPPDSWSILQSPRQFGQFTLSLLLNTLPQDGQNNFVKVSAQPVDESK